MKKIKFIIDSDLENVALVGMSVNKLCSLTPFSEMQTFQIELCTVEAINNSIIHAYNGSLMHEVEIILSIEENFISLEVCDRGKIMDSKILEKANINLITEEIDNPKKISESGRGLAVIKEVMDRVSYRSDSSCNRLMMIKYF